MGHLASVRRFRISLRIAGDDLDPDEVTSLLGIAPCFAYRKEISGKLRKVIR